MEKCLRLNKDLLISYAESGAGRLLVLLHAFPLDHLMWEPQVTGLQKDCRLITPDLRGFNGTSPFGNTPSIDQMADDVAELLERLKIKEPVIVGGLSMGGYVALAFARRHGERLGGLILADTRAEGDTPEAKANRETAIAFAQAHEPLDVIQSMLPRLLGPETLKRQPDLAMTITGLVCTEKSEAIVAALQALRDRPDAGPGLANIKVPTLVIVGADDVLTPPAAAQSLAERIPGATLVTIPEAGHLSNMEQPDKFNDAVRAFLKSYEG
jgi:3-oxoadipate enol-lactonase